MPAFLMSNMNLIPWDVREFLKLISEYGDVSDGSLHCLRLRQGFLQNVMTPYWGSFDPVLKANSRERTFSYISFTIAFASATSRSLLPGPMLSFGICLRWKSCEALFLPLMSIGTTSGSFCLCFAKGEKWCLPPPT